MTSHYTYLVEVNRTVYIHLMHRCGLRKLTLYHNGRLLV